MDDSSPVDRELPGHWHALALCWTAVVVLLASLMAFRAVTFSAIAQMIDMADVPLLYFMDRNYGLVYWAALVLAVLFTVVLLFELKGTAGARPGVVVSREGFRLSASRKGVLLLGLWLAYVGIMAITCRWNRLPGGGELELLPTGFADWLAVALIVAITYLVVAVLSARLEPADAAAKLPGELRGSVPDAGSGSLSLRLGVVYLVGCASVAAYAFYEHTRFWNADTNGGYYYAPFFLAGERGAADLVLYSTSALFSSLAALIGCAGCLLLHWLGRAGRRTGELFSRIDVWGVAALLTIAWTFSLGVPWQVKILPEIRSENGWFLSIVILVHLAAAILPLAFVGLALLRQDFFEPDTDGSLVVTPRRSELVYWALVLFPVYGLLRLVRPAGSRARHVFAMASATLLLILATALVNKIESWFDFEDWRGMVKKAHLPFLRVVLALVCGYFVYLVSGRALAALRRRREAVRRSNFFVGARAVGLRVVVFAFVGIYVTLASWPFWGWGEVSRNVFARTFEFSDRHEFELTFLHWILDFDRDGYAAVLHGADPDDFDSRVQPGGIEPAEVISFPVDRFKIVQPGKTGTFPNVVILYLEGVIPRAISAYGHRTLPDGLIATPHMDSVAAEGTLFTQARCFYPSTWDGWVAVSTGRFLRVSEMRHESEFLDKYSRYNNVYKVLNLAGVDRWCHADCAPYYDLLVPVSMRGEQRTAWKSADDDHSSRVSNEEEKRGIWRGDKRNDRILEFIDDVKPGERFFICEHMSDSHFPWERTSKERAAELGFPDGLQPYEQDALLSTGTESEKLSIYFQVITRVDAQIGQILDKLKERDLYDDTMVVIVGDHGCQFWEHEHLYYVAHLYEESLRVPLIVKIPGVEGGRKSDEPVLHLDVLTTLLDLAGAELANPDEVIPLSGRSLLPTMRGERFEPGLYRDRDMILTTHYDMLGVVSNFRHKLIFDRPSGTYLLFDLEEDPEEKNNLADDRPEMLQELLLKLKNMAARHKGIVGFVDDGRP